MYIPLPSTNNAAPARYCACHDIVMMSWGRGSSVRKEPLGRKGRMIFEDLAMPDGAEYFGQMLDFVIRRIVSHYYTMCCEARQAPILVTTAAMFSK